jgi:predicted N-acetyltransferase YhbS
VVGPEAAMEITIRRATAADGPDCGRICYGAFASVANRHGFPADFPSVEAATLFASQLIAHPGFFGIVAEHDGVVVGSNFLDERSTIFGVGPITVDPEVQDHQIGRALMTPVLDEWAARGAPGVRLLQVAYNNRSMSFYAKLGFDIREPFAALQGEPVAARIPGYTVRGATQQDLDACNALCVHVHGHDRSGELQDALSHAAASVVERLGRITGYTTGIGFFAHSVAETNDDLIALIGAAEQFSGPGFLVPLRNTALLRWCLHHGLRVVFMMNLMTMGLYQEPRGAFLASMGY